MCVSFATSYDHAGMFKERYRYMYTCSIRTCVFNLSCQQDITTKDQSSVSQQIIKAKFSLLIPMELYPYFNYISPCSLVGLFL